MKAKLNICSCTDRTQLVADTKYLYLQWQGTNSWMSLLASDDLLTDLPPEVRDLVLKEAMDEDPRLPYMREKCIEVFGADPHHLPPTNRHRIKPGQGHGEMTVGSLGDDEEDFRKNPNRRQDSEFFAGVARELRERCGALKDDHPPRIHEDDLELAQLHELYVSTLDAESRLQEARVWADLEILHAQRVRLMLERMGPT